MYVGKDRRKKNAEPSRMEKALKKVKLALQSGKSSHRRGGAGGGKVRVRGDDASARIYREAKSSSEMKKMKMKMKKGFGSGSQERGGRRGKGSSGSNKRR